MLLELTRAVCCSVLLVGIRARYFAIISHFNCNRKLSIPLQEAVVIAGAHP